MRIRPWWIFLLAVVLTAAVYAPGLSGGWLFDDYPNIVDNAGVQPQKMSVASLTRAALSSPSSTLKRPLASLTFAFNYLAGGLDPFGWKLVNLLIHLLNGLLVFLLARGVIDSVGSAGASRDGSCASARCARSAQDDGTGERFVQAGVRPPSFRAQGAPATGGAESIVPTSGVMAALIAGAWMLLPINLTGVLYVVQRMESLANLFVLLGLWGYVAGRRRMRAGRRGLWLCVVSLIVATALGLTAKETAVMLPLYAFLVECIVFRFRRGGLGGGLADPLPGPPPQAGEGGVAGTPQAGQGDARECQNAGSLSPCLQGGEETRRERAIGSRVDERLKGRTNERGLPQSTRQPRDWRIATLFVVVLLLPLVAGLAWMLPRVLSAATWASRDFTLATRLLSEARIVVDYIAWTLMPLPTWLSFYHDGFVVSQGLLQPWTALASMGVLAALLALAWWQRHRRPLVTLGIALYFGCHLLTATILPLELVYEHRNYFASFGLLLAVVPVLLEAGRGLRARHALLGVLAAWWIALTAFTAYQWGEPLRLATELAARAPESPRAQYTLGRLLLMRGNYNPDSPYTQRAYAPLERAAALPGSSILPLQALLFMNVRMGQPVKPAWWDRLIAKLKAEPLGVQDDSSLVAMTDCAVDGDCPFNHRRMVAAFEAALSHHSPSAQVLAAYGNYAWNVLGDRQQAVHMTERAIRTAPNEPAYRVTLARMAAVLGRADVIRLQLRALKRLNYGGRLNHHIAELEQLLDR